MSLATQIRTWRAQVWQCRAMTVPGDGQAVTLSTDESLQETDGWLAPPSSVRRNDSSA